MAKDNNSSVAPEKVFWDSLDLIIDTIIDVRDALDDRKLSWFEVIKLGSVAFPLGRIIREATTVDWSGFDLLDSDIASKSEEIISKLRIEQHVANEITIQAIRIVEGVISLSINIVKIQ